MNCYSCDGYIMKPIKLAHGLPALQCNKCGGTHIDLLSYRAWRDDDKKLAATVEVSEAAPTDNKKALVCQRCSKIMLKYKIATHRENYIDLCTTCDDAWLDAGEWQLLGSLQQQDKLAHILTEPWQNKLKKEIAEENFANKYQSLFGEIDYEKVNEISDWLREHENRHELLNYIRIKSHT